jgi:hypothetical protein
MAFKLTLKDWISFFLSKEPTEATLSISPNKKFSGVKGYIEQGKFGKTIAGRITRQTDNGYIYYYEYYMHDKSNYRVTINHVGEKVNKIELYMRCPGALPYVKNALNQLEKNVPDIPAGESVDTTVEVAPIEDYSDKELNELVDIFDKKLNSFKKNTALKELEALDRVKNAISEKVNLKPLAERAPFNKAIGNMSTYIDALKMQMSSPLANHMQFANVYIPQIETALSELAALLA